MEAIWQALGVYRQALYSQFTPGVDTGASATFIVCDIVAHLPDEVELIWRKKWDSVKVLYILARYFGLFYILSHLIVNSLPVSYELTITPRRTYTSRSSCKNHFFIYSTIGGGVCAHLLINSIFFLRMYALYGCTRRALICWASFVLVMLGFESYGGAWSAIRAVRHAIPPPLPEWTGCLTAPVEYHTGVLFASIPTLIEGIVYFVATARKLNTLIPTHPTITSMEVKSIQRFSPLAAALFQDGAFWSLAITVLSALCTWVAIYRQGLYILNVTSWIHTVFSCGAAHIVLNLRRIAARQEQGTMRSQGQKTRLETLRFAEIVTSSSSTSHPSKSLA
ncbi:hypothetical protein BKA70DRAFT_1422474 [Coprinopsis sp. MPI-PUGE-AT-0042]|nr:hypothetical protein BKA70DRAFT_1422474 [Coprinopsis sp. MPI-PUGE-AT-0042]